MLRSGVEKSLKRCEATPNSTMVNTDLANLLISDALITRQSRSTDLRKKLITQALGFLNRIRLGGFPALTPGLMLDDI